MTKVRPVEILLVEDDPADARRALEMLNGSTLSNAMTVVWDGETALRLLRQEDVYADAPRPDLVLLDLSLPRMHGREVMATMRADATLRDIPIVLLTTTDDAPTELAADGYITKPVDREQLMRVVQYIDDLDLAIVRVPASPNGAVR